MTDGIASNQRNIFADIGALAEQIDQNPRPDTILIRNEGIQRMAIQQSDMQQIAEVNGSLSREYERDAAMMATVAERLAVGLGIPEEFILGRTAGRVEQLEERFTNSVAAAMEGVVGLPNTEETRELPNSRIIDELVADGRAYGTVQTGTPATLNSFRNSRYLTGSHLDTAKAKAIPDVDENRLYMALEAAVKAHDNMDFRGCYDAIPLFKEAIHGVRPRDDGKLPNLVHIDTVSEMVAEALDSFKFLNEAMRLASLDDNDDEFVHDEDYPNPTEVRRYKVIEQIRLARTRMRWIAGRDMVITSEGERVTYSSTAPPPYPSPYALNDTLEDPNEDISELSEMDRLALEIREIIEAQERAQERGYDEREDGQLRGEGQLLAGTPTEAPEADAPALTAGVQRGITAALGRGILVRDIAWMDPPTADRVEELIRHPNQAEMNNETDDHAF